MNGPNILDQCRTRLSELISDRRNDYSTPQPLSIDPWLAMSLMQKAIRRSHTELALRSAVTLIETSPDRLWRRLLVTAFEDIGVADHEVVSLVTVGLTGKRFRAKIGGDWAVASYLISRMCGTVKCRASDDLLAICETNPNLEKQRLDLTFRPVSELIDRVTGNGVLPERALSLWYALGNNRYISKHLRERKGDPQMVFDALCDRGYPDTVVEVAREGFRKYKEILIPFSILLGKEFQKFTSHVQPDDLPPEEMIGDVPCWAYDMHVREGKVAMAELLNVDCETSRWFNANLPPKRRGRFIGSVLFSIESGLVDRRLCWEAANDLRRMANLECYGLEQNEAAEIMELLRNDLPLLNEIRIHVVAGKRS